MATTSRVSWIRTLLIMLPLLLLGGCRAGSGSMSPGSPGGGYGGEGYGSGGYDDGNYGGSEYEEYGGDEDYAEAEAAADYSPDSGGLSSRGRSKQASMIETRNEFKAEREYAAASPPEEPMPDPVLEPTTGTVTTDLPEPSETPATKAPDAASSRQIIYTATMQVSVYNLAQAIAEAEALPDRLGGWLHQRSDNQLILRIPAEHLEQAMATIAELGVVDYRLLEALDVTAAYTDLESRLRVLAEMHAQLEALLAKAKTVEEALEIRKALDSVTLELERARSQMRELAKSIAFSTLILRFVERGPAVTVPSSNDPFTWVDELGVEITEYR